MKLHILTIVLDGMPWLPQQLITFNRLPREIDWTWYVIEGAAMNGGSTAWCQPQLPRKSGDGTTEFLWALKDHPRVRFESRHSWESKDLMCNTALEHMAEPGVLLQVDADELWTADQIAKIAMLFVKYPRIQCARFFCRYYVGPNIIVTSTTGWGNRPGEWLRAWRFKPGMQFKSHEPPVLIGVEAQCRSCGTSLDREITASQGLIFEHPSYMFEKQVAYKEEFYGYKDAVLNWRRLQENKTWPVKDLHSFLPWVEPGVTADRLFK